MCVGPVLRCVENLKIFKVTMYMCSVVCCVVILYIFNVALCVDFVLWCVETLNFFKKSPGTVTDLVVLYKSLLKI